MNTDSYKGEDSSIQTVKLNDFKPALRLSTMPKEETKLARKNEKITSKKANSKGRKKRITKHKVGKTNSPM